MRIYLGGGGPWGNLWDRKLEASRAGESRLRHVLSITGFDTSILPICKDSLGLDVQQVDMNYDLLLDHSEINAIYLDKYEPCIKPLFNSCDSFKDGKLSNNEWCYCFQKPGGKAGVEVGAQWPRPPCWVGKAHLSCTGETEEQEAEKHSWRITHSSIRWHAKRSFLLIDLHFQHGRENPRT